MSKEQSYGDLPIDLHELARKDAIRLGNVVATECQLAHVADADMFQTPPDQRYYFVGPSICVKQGYEHFRMQYDTAEKMIVQRVHDLKKEFPDAWGLVLEWHYARDAALIPWGDSGWHKIALLTKLPHVEQCGVLETKADLASAAVQLGQEITGGQSYEKQPVTNSLDNATIIDDMRAKDEEQALERQRVFEKFQMPPKTAEESLRDGFEKYVGQQIAEGTVKELRKGANPKDILGMKKPALRLVPPALMLFVAGVMKLGARKYGPYNWRTLHVRKTVYLEAAMRHLLAALDGEDKDPESGLPHEAHVAACMGILLDAASLNILIDDRPVAGPAPQIIENQTEKTK